MTEIWKRVYKDNIVGILKGLSDKKYQNDVWLNRNNPNNLVDSFTEAACMLFDDCVVKHYLEQGEILFDVKVTQALRELDAAIDPVNEYRPQEEIISDPLMDVVREKAARALYLIQVSTYEGSTVDIAIPGQSYPGEVVR
ncbi:MAG: hypothetical protein K2X09_06190 [Rickettsiales bacterium]|nr:hypothetical protein [Rickettsiales bacterium]